MTLRLTPVACAALLAFPTCAVLAQSPAQPAPGDAGTLTTVTVRAASADASAQGLSPAYPGGQVARGGRAGILGTRDGMETPFSITSYTNDLIQDRQARSVGDVLQNDPTVRVARGFGNFQESYFIRGFVLGSDDVAYNGLYSLLPRQSIATELFERVEVLRGASAFLTGANPSGGGIGGSINLLPKRAPNEPLSRVTVGVNGEQPGVAVDLARRFGPDGATGVRLNAALRDGESAVDGETSELGLLAIGLDWRSRDVRLSGDVGYQNNRLKGTRTNVSLGDFLTPATGVPRAPDASTNWAQPWSYSNERDLFGTLRGEWDITPSITGWAAYGARRSEEANALANLAVTNQATGAGYVYRFDNTREDKVDTGEIGLRGKLRTGSVGHELVASYSAFRLSKDNAYAFDFGTLLPTNLYDPVAHPKPAFGPGTGFGGTLSDPRLTGRTHLRSFAVGDTLSFLNDSVLLTLGARHQAIEVTDYAYGTAVQTARYEKSRTSPAVGAVWKASKQLSVYANYIEGLSAGETAPATAGGLPVNNAGESLSPYVAKQKEIGLKYDAGRFGGGVALFSTTRPRAFVDPATLVFSANGEDRHDGIEATLFGEAARGLRLLGGLTWLDAKQKSTGSAATDGKRVIGVPRFQATVGSEWDVPGVRGLALDGRLSYTGASYADAVNTLRVPGWTRVDAGVRYLTEVQGRLVTLRARVDNIADRNHWASSGGYAGAGYLVAGAPRTFSLSAQVDF